MSDDQDTTHYHVTANGNLQGWAFTTLYDFEAEAIVREEADTRIPGTVTAILVCDAADCGDYIDLLAFDQYARLDVPALDREHARMVIESDGHGPA